MKRISLGRALLGLALAASLTANAAAETTLLNVSYDPTRELYQAFNPEFARHWKAQTGETVTIRQSHGGAGKQASLCLRGTGAKDVLVLVDGVRAGSATGGGFAWEFLPVAELDRVEIVRGPRSSLYGPDAVGGVVQVFTRRAGEEGTVLSARAGAG